MDTTHDSTTITYTVLASNMLSAILTLAASVPRLAARKVATEGGMRLLTVRHVTVYPYVKPVKLGEHRMMFRPRESHDLRLVRTQLIILPRPVQLRWLHDVFDNSVAVATFAGETTKLCFDSTVTLEHTEVALPDYQLEADAATFPFSYSVEDQPDLVRALERSEPSEEVDSWANGMLPEPVDARRWSSCEP